MDAAGAALVIGAVLTGIPIGGVVASFWSGRNRHTRIQGEIDRERVKLHAELELEKTRIHAELDAESRKASDTKYWQYVKELKEDARGVRKEVTALHVGAQEDKTALIRVNRQNRKVIALFHSSEEQRKESEAARKTEQADCDKRISALEQKLGQKQREGVPDVDTSEAGQSSSAAN